MEISPNLPFFRISDAQNSINLTKFYKCLETTLLGVDPSKEFQKCLISWYFKEGRNFYWRTQTISPWMNLSLQNQLFHKSSSFTPNSWIVHFLSKFFDVEIQLSTPFNMVAYTIQHGVNTWIQQYFSVLNLNPPWIQKRSSIGAFTLQFTFNMVSPKNKEVAYTIFHGVLR